MPVISEDAAHAMISVLISAERILDGTAARDKRRGRSGRAADMSLISGKLALIREIIAAALADARPNEREPQNHVSGGMQ